MVDDDGGFKWQRWFERKVNGSIETERMI